MAKSDNKTLLLAGGGVAAFAAYEFLLKPWLAAKNAAAAASGALPTLFSPPATSSLVSSPTSTWAPGGVQGSIVDPRITPGGDVGQAMWKKNWTQQQATTRLTALKAAYANAMAQIQAAKSPSSNPAAAGIPAAQQQLAVVQSAIANAEARAAQDAAAGDQAGAAKWAGAAATHRQDAAQLQQRIIAAAAAPAGDPAALAAWEGAAAGFKADYFALTGMNIPGS